MEFAYSLELFTKESVESFSYAFALLNSFVLIFTTSN
jgi:hypothetical protein